MTAYFANPLHPRPVLPATASALFGPQGIAAARALLPLREGGVIPTPLIALPGLARALGIECLHVKDEGQRLGLGSFKALGGAHAVMTLVMEAARRHLSRRIAPAELSAPEVRALAAQMTFLCATDGNHGRSVAQGARLVGARALVLVHAGVSAARAEAIAAQGAEVRRTQGSYDESVAEAARLAEAEGFTLVSDTAWPGYERVPGLVMQGYSALAAEMIEALPEVPTHIFLQAGVGGLATAVAAAMQLHWGAAAPKVVVVEPERAPCLYESARAGRPVALPHGEATVMAMLECFEPSLTAFQMLGSLAEGYVLVPEAAAPEAMRKLAFPAPGDRAVVAGESGGAGLAGLMTALADPDLATELGLDAKSRVALVVSEGATDPETYARLVGETPATIAAKRQTAMGASA